MIWMFFDASALVKRYSTEDGTVVVNEVFRRVPIERITCAMIGILEIVSVLARKQNDGRLSSRGFAQAMSNLNHELLENDDFSATSFDDDLMLSALELITQHNINSTDAIVLRLSMDLQQVLEPEGHRLVLWSSDKRLLRAAKQEGVAVFDPEVDTKSELDELLR